MYYDKESGNYVDYATVILKKDDFKKNMVSSLQSKSRTDLTELRVLDKIIYNMIAGNYHTASSVLSSYDGGSFVSCNQYVQHNDGGKPAMIHVGYDEKKEELSIVFSRNSKTNEGTTVYDDFKASVKTFVVDYIKNSVDKVRIINEGSKVGAVRELVFDRDFEEWLDAKNHGVRNPRIVAVVNDILKNSPNISAYMFYKGSFIMKDINSNELSFKFDGTLRGFADGINSYSESMSSMPNIPLMKELAKIQSAIEASLELQKTTKIFPDIKETKIEHKM